MAIKKLKRLAYKQEDILIATTENNRDGILQNRPIGPNFHAAYYIQYTRSITMGAIVAFSCLSSKPLDEGCEEASFKGPA